MNNCGNVPSMQIVISMTFFIEQNVEANVCGCEVPLYLLCAQMIPKIVHCSFFIVNCLLLLLL